ncbi:MAG: GNAT family N-acetyltransferase [Eubacteriales bacterium]
MKLSEKIVKTSAPDFDYIKSFMKRVFPQEELFPMSLLMALNKLKRCNFQAFYEDEQFIGILYTIEFPKFVHIKYLAVNDVLHSKGYGTEMLHLLKGRYGDETCTLFVETLDSTAENFLQREKRIAFYERNGFHQVGVKIGNKKPLYDILSSNPNLRKEHCKKALRFIPMKVFVER